MRRLAGVVLALGAAAVPALGQGQLPIVPLATAEPAAESTEALDWTFRLGAAKGALDQGFPALARSLFETLRTDAAVPPAAQRALELDLATALLALNEGAAVLELWAARENLSSAEKLRVAMAHYLQGELRAASGLLSSFPPTDLGAEDRAWYLFAEGLLRQAGGDFTAARPLFVAAEEAATSRALRAHFQLVRLRGELTYSETSEELVAQLRSMVRSLGPVGGFESSRLLAIALYRLGRVDEAVDVIESLLEQPELLERRRGERLLLLLAVFLGDESGRGRLALRQLLSTATTVELQRTALALLVRAPFEGRLVSEFRELLGTLLDRPAPHPLEAELLATRAALAARNRNFEAAEADLERLLEEAPRSELLPGALRLLAYLNWERKPPRYRTAASYLDRLRPLLPPGPARARAYGQMGDCFFLNGDYANATEAYASAQREDPGLATGQWLFQRVLAAIRSGDLDAAVVALDAASAASWPERWKAEYNLLDAMREAGDLQRAFARVRALLAEEATASLPAELLVRLRWMELRLALDAGRSAEVPDLADELLAWIEAAGAEKLSAADRAAVQSHVWLIKGEALLRMGLRAEGMAVLQELRVRHPDSGPEMLSYLVESRLAAAENSVVDAQLSLINLADRFPQSRFSPIALWEAALLAEQRGLDSAYREAMGILDRLAKTYPQHPIVFFALLKQADLSRKLNDFGTALSLYESLLASYPDHSERARAELSRGDCLLARGAASADSLVAASVVYERLFMDPRSRSEMGVEAGFKWAAALRQRGLMEEMRTALFLLKDRYFDDAERARMLGGQGRYWLARALLELAGALEAQGELTALDQAQEIYAEVLESGLPGAAIARERLARWARATRAESSP